MEERRVEFLPWARAEKLWGKVFPIIAIARNGEEKSLEGYSYAEARKVFPESKFALVKEVEERRKRRASFLEEEENCFLILQENKATRYSSLQKKKTKRKGL